MKLEQFFSQLWKHYTEISPQAKVIFREFQARNGAIQNDHVAFRTFNCNPITLDTLSQHFVDFGYRAYDNYNFKEKKLCARSFVPKEPDQALIFISELRVEQLSEPAQKILRRLCAEIPPEKVNSPEVFFSPSLWSPPTWEEYQLLLAESEYAAWLSAWGLRANHFTVRIDTLKTDKDMEKALKVLDKLHIPLNEHGGIIKGKTSDLLVQASTLADKCDLQFAAGDKHTIPGCYYEFAQRYADSHGNIYQGFVPANADKIFESTDSSPSREGV